MLVNWGVNNVEVVFIARFVTFVESENKSIPLSILDMLAMEFASSCSLLENTSSISASIFPFNELSKLS